MAQSKKNLKATKKFENKHLKGVLDNRKAGVKIKQRAQLNAKKRSKRAGDNEFYKGAKDEAVDEDGGIKKATAGVGSMSVDEFFQGGFEIINQDGKAKANGKKRKRDGAVQPARSQDGEDGAASASDEDDASEAADDIGMSKGAMDALAKDDPEFYKYLQENDPEALEFDENVDMAELDALSGSDEEQPMKKAKRDKKAAVDEFEVSNELTREMVARWETSMTTTHSLRAARQVVLAFRSAAHLNEDAEETKQKYTISSPKVFHDILVIALKRIPEVIAHHLPVKESAAGKVYVSTESKKFKTISILIRSYTASVIYLLGSLSDEATLKMTLSALTPLLPYLLSFRKVLKSLIKTVVHFWSQSSSSEPTRITAFLVLRRLVVIGDKGIREAVLKVTYQGLIQSARTTNMNTIQGINLMKASAAEMWGIDQNVGYTTAFTFLRQLAIHLRNSIVHNQNDAYRAVYNWQYVHSLDFWSCVLSEHCNSLKEAEAGKESQLRPLIYPLVQVTLGAMRLIPTAIYFPLRFHLVRSLLRISRATGTYIPLASALLEVLNSAEMKKAPKQSTLKPLDFAIAYKAPKSYLRTRVYQDGVGEQVVELFSEYLMLWAKSIAFPEFALPVVIMLKRWLKEVRGGKKGLAGNKNAKLSASVMLLVQKMEANSKFIEEKRAKVEFAIKDRTQVDAFLKEFDVEKTPVGAFVVGQRKMREEKVKMMDKARKDEKRREEYEDMKDGEDGFGDDSEEGEDGVFDEDADGDDGMDDLDDAGTDDEVDEDMHADEDED